MSFSFEQFFVESWSEDFVFAISQEKRGIDCLELPLVQHTRLPDFHEIPSLLSSKLCMVSWLMVLFKVMADGKKTISYKLPLDPILEKLFCVKAASEINMLVLNNSLLAASENFERVKDDVCALSASSALQELTIG